MVYINSAAVLVLQPPKRMGKKTSSQLLQKRNMLVSGIMSLYRRGELVLNSFHQDYSTYSSYVASLDVFHFSHPPPPPNFLSLISDRNGGGKKLQFLTELANSMLSKMDPVSSTGSNGPRKSYDIPPSD